jgi:Asp-tRNA(Asn)/Glu-tRNA(Gln) amidotransferase A subunit family amidase
MEATISEIHAGVKKGELTFKDLTQTYLERISRYDKRSRLNAVVVVNPNALAAAERLDREFQETGRMRPLHGIPVIVKDNYETKDMQTTAGSEALAGFIPPDDAYQVEKLREAGAVILAKSNMAEWAFSPYQTQSSIAGITRNPYDLSRVPAGSSGGTAAAVAANLGTVGLGTDTGNSIRGPASHCCLVGLRSTMGLTSRNGIIPLYRRNDIGGPMTRTVEDTARILDVIAGVDPDDPITAYAEGRIPETYLSFLKKDALQGVRVGVFRFYTNLPYADEDVKNLFEKALEDMETQGAVLADPFTIPDFGELTKNLWCDTFRHDINQYFTSLGDAAPLNSLTEVYNSGKFSVYIKDRLYQALEEPIQDQPSCRNIYEETRNIVFRNAVEKAMAAQNVDVIVYPTWNSPPNKLTDPRRHAGDNSQLIPPHTGLPAISVPMGFSPGHLPAGLQIVGKWFGDGELLGIAYAYEQATQHRRPSKRFD